MARYKGSAGGLEALVFVGRGMGAMKPCFMRHSEFGIEGAGLGVGIRPEVDHGKRHSRATITRWGCATLPDAGPNSTHQSSGEFCSGPSSILECVPVVTDPRRMREHQHSLSVEEVPEDEEQLRPCNAVVCNRAHLPP